jgi:hypothetical protein
MKVTITATRINIPIGTNTPNIMSPISFPKTNIYTEDIIATVNQQLMIIAALKSNVLHRLWGIINRIKDYGLEHDVLIYVYYIFCLGLGLKVNSYSN